MKILEMNDKLWKSQHDVLAKLLISVLLRAILPLN